MSEYKVRLNTKKHKSVKQDDVLQMFQQLGTLVENGTPLLQSLRLTADQVESEKLSKVINGLADAVERGTSLHVAAMQYPKVFKDHWCKMMHIGEMTGRMGEILIEIKRHLEKQKALRAKIVSALTYPVILAFVAVASVGIMLGKVIPTFSQFFQDAGSKLPDITRFVLSMSNALREYGPVAVVILVVSVFIFRKIISTPAGGRVWNGFLLNLPALGPLLVVAAMQKFSAQLGLLLKSGTPLLDALKIVRGMFTGNHIYYEALGDVCTSIARGDSLATALESTGVFTPMLVNIIKVGEASGRLADVLEETASFYSVKVESLLVRLTSAMEPLMVIGMGVAVAFLLASVYLPMFQMSSGGGA